MNNFQEVPYPIIPRRCSSHDHWFDIIVDGTCERCSKGLAPAPEETMEALEDEQMRHREAPTDEEIDEMYALAGSDSTEYRHAHD